MARVRVDNTGNIFPEDKVTIADLAAFTPILKRDSHHLTIYEVQEAFDAEWRWEIAEWQYEYATGYSARFKDGSAIAVGAWRGDDEANYGRR